MGSARVRLSAGFGALLCVVAAALLINLYTLASVERATQRVSDRQRIRSQTYHITEICERMCAHQSKFIQTAAGEKEYILRAEKDLAEIRASFKSVNALPLKLYEKRELYNLSVKVHGLADIIRVQVVTVRAQVLEGLRPKDELKRLEAEAHEMLQEAKHDNDNLIRIMDVTTDGAKLEAGAAWEKSRTIAWCTLAVGLAFGALTVFLTHRAIIRPINEIVDGTRALAGGDLTKRLSTPAVAEFRQLAESFNRMAEALQAHQRQLVESEKLATVGRFAAGVAHEINNPIAVILGYAKTLIGRQPPDERVREGLVAIEEEACHCEKIVSELLDFSRPAGEPDEEPVNPARVTAEVVEMARVLRIVGQTRVEVNVVDRPLALGMGRAGLRQIILNFVTNAFEALREVDGAELHIEGRVEPPQAGPEAPNPGQAAGPTFVLRFADNGPGIPEAHRDKLFEPFFTTKSEGTGLGLAITYAIAEAHGGQIQVEPGEEAGTTFIVRLPVQPSVGG